ncbi:MAG: N-acetyl sugar amidotransferase [Deltaproteobacteria bacterium]|nr:N-acetyl sugar amidotransferase [Deltaproteobacteria bacterium]
MRRCTKCVLPETHETIMFDEQGVCNICHQHEYKQTEIDWDARKKELDKLIEEYRGKYDYDCIIPFSGGKDSAFTAHYLMKEYGLKPLLVRFHHGFLRPQLYENTRKLIRKLGVDLLDFTANWQAVQKFMLQSFLEKGDFCWHCHSGIFAYPMWVAIRYNVPLIFWGEASAEYTSYYQYDEIEEVDEKRFHRFTDLGITAQDMFVRLDGSVSERDLKPFTYPPIKELRKIGCRSVCLGSFIPWDVKNQVKIIQDELGWQGDEVENVPPENNYEKIECYLQCVRDYIKYIKRGYTRPSHLMSLDIRNRRATRSEAMNIVDQYEGKRPHSLDVFLSYVGLTEEEFLDVALSHAVSPHQHDPKKMVPGKKPHDYDQWPRYEPMPREQALVQLRRWQQRHNR